MSVPRSLQPRRGALLRALLISAAAMLGVITLGQWLIGRGATSRSPAPRRATGLGEVIIPGLAPNAIVEIGRVPAESVHDALGSRCAREPDDGGAHAIRCLLPSGEMRSVTARVPGEDADGWTIIVPDPGGRTTLLH